MRSNSRYPRPLPCLRSGFSVTGTRYLGLDVPSPPRGTIGPRHGSGCPRSTFTNRSFSKILATALQICRDSSMDLKSLRWSKVDLAMVVRNCTQTPWDATMFRKGSWSNMNSRSSVVLNTAGVAGNGAIASRSCATVSAVLVDLKSTELHI